MDISELACHLCGLDEDADYDQLDEALWEKYEISMDNLEKLISHLLPMIDIGVSPITDIKYKGFSTQKYGTGCWLAKVEVK